MATIDTDCVAATDGWLCQVRVLDDGSETRHSVTLTRADFQRLAAGGGTPNGTPNGTPDDLVRRSVEFLLEREPKESILKSFSLTDIGRYFPEYEREITKGG